MTSHPSNTSHPSGGKSVLRRILQHAVSVAFAGLCLWLALRNVDTQRVAGVLASARLLPVALAVLLLITMNAVKCTKMGLLLAPVRRIGFRTLFSAETIAILVDVAFPFRLQELIKSFLIARTERLSTGLVLGAVLADRAVASLVLMALLLVVGLTRTLQPGSTHLLWGGVAGAASVVLLTIVLACFPGWSDPLLRRLARWRGVSGIVVFLSGILEGLRAAAHRPRILAAVLVITMVEWAVLAAAFGCVARAVGVPLRGDELLASVATIHIAFAIPSTTSGAVGIYEFAGRTTLVVAYGMDPELALPLVVAFHVVLLGSGLIAGSLGLVLSRIGVTEIVRIRALAKAGAPALLPPQRDKDAVEKSSTPSSMTGDSCGRATPSR